jgi:type II secretory pathway component PulF
MADADYLAAEVEKGKSIFVANQSARLIPPLFGFCVQTASGRDALPQSIEKLAVAYETRAAHWQAVIRTMLFPLMIVLLGVVMGVCVLSMFLPLYTLIHNLSGG